MEWQAGYVCGALLMPATHFRAQLTDVQRELGLTGPLLKGTAETDTVLGLSDFVVLLLPTTRETENFINAARLRAMKPTAWMLNFARGALIVDADLIAAVQSKTIAGAVLDVFREEPLPATHPFWKTEGIMVLPHIGGGHPDRRAIVGEMFAENARRYLEGRPLNALVDRERGY